MLFLVQPLLRELAMFLFCSIVPEQTRSIATMSAVNDNNPVWSRAPLAALRRLIADAQGLGNQAEALAFDLPALDRFLPQQGLPLGALHEIAPNENDDNAAAFGFMAALLGRFAKADRAKAPVLIVTGPESVAGYGRPFGHGLARLGVDPSRVILVQTQNDKQTLWALEEILRSGRPAVVGGTIARLGFRESQRLHFAARESGRPLVLLRPAGLHGSNVAMTRWRIRASTAARDRSGLIVRWRWNVTLERCRNGRPGAWLVEFDDAYRFSLAAAMADPALPRSADEESVPRSG